MLRARVDRHRCVGAGNCITIAPTAFDWLKGDFGKADVIDAESVEEELLRAAALACPTDAIVIEEMEELLPWQLRGKTGPARRVAKTFMFTDIVGSTNLVEVMGDEAWETLLRWHDQTLRALFAAHQGEEVVATGDGFFVGFDSPEGAWPARWPSSVGSPSTARSMASPPRSASACMRPMPRKLGRTSGARVCMRRLGSRPWRAAARSSLARTRRPGRSSTSPNPDPSR